MRWPPPCCGSPAPARASSSGLPYPSMAATPPADAPSGPYDLRRSDHMQITRSSIETQKGPADWFTGDVYIDAIAAPAGTSTFAAANVHFTPGVGTAWHTHPHGQTI